MKHKPLGTVRLLEKKLKGADPREAGKLTKTLVKLKDDWINGV